MSQSLLWTPVPLVEFVCHVPISLSLSVPPGGGPDISSFLREDPRVVRLLFSTTRDNLASALIISFGW